MVLSDTSSNPTSDMSYLKVRMKELELLERGLLSESMLTMVGTIDIVRMKELELLERGLLKPTQFMVQRSPPSVATSPRHHEYDGILRSSPVYPPVSPDPSFGTRGVSVDGKWRRIDRSPSESGCYLVPFF